MLRLDVVDVVANSIIEINKIDGSRNVLIDDAKKYGEEVSKYLKGLGYYTIFKIKPSLTESFEVKHANYFKKYYVDETFGYELKNDKSIEEIVSVFRDCIADGIVGAFSCDEVVKKSFGERGKFKVLKKKR